MEGDVITNSGFKHHLDREVCIKCENHIYLPFSFDYPTLGSVWVTCPICKKRQRIYYPEKLQIQDGMFLKDD